MTGDASANAAALLQLYDRALPQVYGYLVRRCDSQAMAEDLTAESFMAAATAITHDASLSITTGWLITTARHKLIDHWRRQERHRLAVNQLGAQTLGSEHSTEPIAIVRAHEILERLSCDHRAALTLRYIDDLPVPEVAALLERSIHATESLIMRAKAAFRQLSSLEGEPS